MCVLNDDYIYGQRGYLRGGGIVIRTQDGPTNPFIPLFLHTLGSDYYTPH